MDEHTRLPFAQYLHDVQVYLGALTPEQRQRVLQELEQHLHDAAQHAGADPHDPVFQATVIERLGSSRQLGRDLARAHRPAADQRASLLVGGGAALSALVLFLAALPVAFILRHGQLMVDMLTGAPVALIPTMLVLHIIYRPLRPQQSWQALGCGTIGMIALFILTVYHDLLELTGVHDTILHRPIDMLNIVPGIGTLLLSLLGIWFILIGRLSRATGVPATPEFGWMSLYAGVSTLVFLLGGQFFLAITALVGTPPPAIQGTLGLLMMLVGIGLVLSHMAWAGIAAIWLLQRRASLPGQAA